MESVGETETGHHVVLADRVLLARGQRVSGHALRLGIEQPIHQVDEMTSFAEDCSAEWPDRPSSMLPKFRVN